MSKRMGALLKASDAANRSCLELGGPERNHLEQARWAPWLPAALGLPMLTEVSAGSSLAHGSLD